MVLMMAIQVRRRNLRLYRKPRPAAPVIGDAVTVKGTVVEFIPSSDPTALR